MKPALVGEIPTGHFKEPTSLDVSIIIVTRNRQQMLKECIESLMPAFSVPAQGDTPKTNSEIIVVDNFSDDETVSMLRDDFQSVRIIQNEFNNGVAPARNQALALARGRYLLIFDDDAKILPGQNFRELIDHMDRRPEIGILGCTSLAADGSINISKRTFSAPIHVILRRLRDITFLRLWVDSLTVLKLHHLEGCDLSKPTEVNFLEGFFMLIRRDLLEEIGLLDERMFYGFEDADICARAQKAGSKVIFYPGFKAYHLVSAITRKKGSLKLLVKHSRSFLRYYLKHRKWIIQKNEEMLADLGLQKK